MMNLWYKETQRYEDIYDIVYDSKGYPQFLIWTGEEWKRVSAKHFTPFAPWDSGEQT